MFKRECLKGKKCATSSGTYFHIPDVHYYPYTLDGLKIKIIPKSLWNEMHEGLKMDDKVEIDLCEGSDEGFESLQDNYIVKHFLDRRCDYRSLGNVFCFGDKYFEYPFLCLKDGRFYLIYTKRFLDNFARELNWSTGLIFHGKSYDSKCD